MKSKIKIKVCGMRDSENIRALLTLKPDYMGFIFYPKSKRFVGDELDAQLLASFPPETQKIGVFVNQEESYILQMVDKYHLNGVQLHGKETPELCALLKQKGLLVFKVFSVGQSFDFAELEEYETVCDYYLFDTKGEQHGGHGIAFDWSLLQQYPSSKPLILSGGIDAKNIMEIPKLDIPIHAIDVNSRFEIEPALKDIELLNNTVFKAFRHEA